jgi:hypothetical protein
MSLTTDRFGKVFTNLLLAPRREIKIKRIRLERSDVSGLRPLQRPRKALTSNCLAFVCLMCSASEPLAKLKAQIACKSLKSLVGAPGLEPGTR